MGVANSPSSSPSDAARILAVSSSVMSLAFRIRSRMTARSRSSYAESNSSNALSCESKRPAPARSSSSRTGRTTTRRPSCGSFSRRTYPARSIRLTTPVTAPVVRPISSANCPAVIGPVEVRMFMHCRSVKLIPLRCATAWKRNSPVTVLLRFSTSSARSNSSRFFGSFDIPLDILHHPAYPTFILCYKIFI
jgi:hypothetical protein